MIESMLASRAARAEQVAAGPRIAFARPRRGTATVMGDGHRLERAIDNIIDNAISFSPPGGLVCIAATRLGDEVHVRVDDDGPGIPAAQREAIFRDRQSVVSGKSVYVRVDLGGRRIIKK